MPDETPLQRAERLVKCFASYNDLHDQWRQGNRATFDSLQREIRALVDALADHAAMHGVPWAVASRFTQTWSSFTWNGQNELADADAVAIELRTKLRRAPSPGHIRPNGSDLLEPPHDLQAS